MFTFILIYRADFRQQFSKIGEIRSLISDKRVIALTATASITSTEQIVTSLCMKDVVYVRHNPDRPNITLECKVMPNSQLAWSEYLQQDAELLKTCRLDTPRRGYFCCTIEMTCRLYEFFEAYLGDQSYTDLTCHNPETRIFAMYHSESARSVKEAVVKSLSDSNGVVRRVFATTSLSMGVNCPNVREVVFWGPPKDLEEYFQECGRAGRDGQLATAILLYSTSQLQHCNNEMKHLCTSKECMRQVVLRHFGYSTESFPKSKACCTVCSTVE